MDLIPHMTDMNEVENSTKPTKARDILNVNMKVVTTTFVLVAVVLFQQATSATPWTPLEWQQEGGKLIGWSGDLDGNYIQDELDQMDPNAVVDCIVLLNKCIELNDLRDSLGRFGDIAYIGKYLTFVSLSGVRVGDISRIAANADVAMVQWDEVGEFALDVSNPAVRKRTSAAFSPDTVDDAFGFQGTGIGIAILDSGVDNEGGPGTTHTFLPSSKVTGTYDAEADDDTVDPDDVDGHGTLVAGIALGTGGTLGKFQGVAPDANLIDMKLGDSGGSTEAVLRAVEKCIDEQDSWGIHVIQTSFAGRSEDGQDVVSQAFNLAVARGMVAVAAIGNYGAREIPAPAAADNVIAVSGYNDRGTVSWFDDIIYADTNYGPRLDDGDDDDLDELKPDVSAPAVAITSALNNTTSFAMAEDGTSMAAPHVSGIAALIMEAKPGINALSVKELIKRTANQRSFANYPALDPDWNDHWGNGQVDAFAAINAATTADPGFPNSPPQCCSCPDVMTATPPEVGVANTLTAVVTNNNTVNTAEDVIVSFGVYIFGNGTNFHSIANALVDISPSSTINVSVPWVPQASPTGEPHACLMVEIGYGLDSNFDNNRCQKNISIQQTSTATYHVRIENNLTEPAVMHLQMANQLDDRWTVKVDKNDFELNPYVCAEVVTMTLDSPADAEPEEMAAIDFNVVATTNQGEEIPHNGFTIIGCVGGGEPPTIEIVEVSETELDIVLADDRSGISHVNIIEANEGEIFVPSFRPGDQEVILRARAAGDEPASFQVEAWDCAFNTARKSATVSQGLPKPIVLLAEDFEGLPLGPNVDEGLAGERVWTDTPPNGWILDESGVPGIGNPATDGVTEWAGWAFTDKEWWISAAEDQNRSQFELGRGTVAVADPDEWDDADHPNPDSENLYDTWLTTPAIDISGCEAGTVQLRFDSSWRLEFDSNYNQTASVTASFDGAESVEVLLWESDMGSPNFKPDATNETVIVDLYNPMGATTLALTFGLFDADNDWWWAIDNVEVSGLPK